MPPLDLAITFCAIAASMSDRARSERNIANADAAKYLDGGLNSCQNFEIREKLTRLEFLLAALVTASA